MKLRLVSILFAVHAVTFSDLEGDFHRLKALYLTYLGK